MEIDVQALLAQTEYREWTDDEYEALSDAIVAGTVKLTPVGPPQIGAEAAAAGRALFLRELGSEEALAEYIRELEDHRPQLAG